MSIQEELAEIREKIDKAIFLRDLKNAISEALSQIDNYDVMIFENREAVGESISQCRKALEAISAYKDAQGELSPDDAKNCAYCLNKLTEICARTASDHAEVVLRAELAYIKDTIEEDLDEAFKLCQNFPAFEQEVRDSLRYLDADR